MKTPIPHLSLLGLAASLAFSLPALAQETPPPPAASSLLPDALTDFTWFSSLGFPDVKDKPFGRWLQDANLAVRNADAAQSYFQGFLLTHPQSNDTILTLTLDERTLFPKNDPRHREGPFEPLSLNATASAVADSLTHPPEPPHIDPVSGLWVRPPRTPYSEFLSYRTQVFVLAWACWRNRLPDLAAQLYEGAQNLPDANSRSTPIPDFHTTLQNDLGNFTFAHALEALRYPPPGLTRTAFVAQLQFLQKNFPLYNQAPLVQHFIDSFQKTIAEDAAHPSISPDALAKLPVDDRVRELIFQLRDISGEGGMMTSGSGPYWGNPFIIHGQDGRPIIEPGMTLPPGFSLPPPSAADQLLDIGFPAVPQLIAALNDTTYTRNSAMFRLAGVNSLQHVSQCAAEILEAIAKKKFYHDGAYQLIWNNNLVGPSAQEAVPPEVQQTITTWWASYQSKGEKQTLIDSVAAGDQSSDAQAQILLTKYPADATTAIIQGIANCTTDGLTVNSPDFFRKNDIRRNLVLDLGKSADPPAIAALQNIFAHDSTPDVRLAAATGLNQHGHPEVIASVITEWQADAARNPKPAQPGRRSRGSGDLLTILIFLTECDSPDAINAITTTLPNLSTNARGQALDWSSWGVRGVNGVLHWPVSPATRAAYEQLFASELADTDPFSGHSAQVLYDDARNSTTPPRFCDIAAAALAANFPNQYKFNFKASPAARDTQIAAIQSTYRQAHPSPPSSPATPAPASP